MDPLKRPVVVAVAPNGGRRTKVVHPQLPMTPAELADVAADAAEAGAAMIHLHVRDTSGAHSLDPGLYRKAIAAIWAEVGERMVIQITTEAVGRYRPDEQMAVVREVRPEAVSLALRELCADAGEEPVFGEFLRFLQQEAIWPQFILYDADDVVRLAALADRGVVPYEQPSVLYVLGRYTERGASGPADILPFLAAAAGRFPDFMVCAFGRHEAACGVAAALLGGGARVGFENNLHLPDGALAPDNAALVGAVVEPLRLLGFMTAAAADLRGC